MMTFLRKHRLVLAITLALLLAWWWPSGGRGLKQLQVDSPLIMLIFFFQGMGVRAAELARVRSFVGLVLLGALVAHGLGPLLGLTAATALQLSGDNRVGLIMMTCMAPTLVSGVVIATQGGGNRTSAIILTITLNLLAIVLIPLNLQWTLGSGAGIDPWGLLRKLLLLILLPAALGHGLVRWREGWQERTAGWIRNAPVVCLGLLVYMSVAEQVERLSGLSLEAALWVLVASLLVHYALLAAMYAGTRYGLRLGVEHARAAAIVCSQKTIPLAVTVWTLTFRDSYPLAIVPAIIFHLSQIYADGFLANYWVNRDAARRDRQP